MRTQSNFWTSRWRRRRFIQGSALATGGAATAALIGCGGDDDDDTGDNGGDPTATTAAGETPTTGAGPTPNTSGEPVQGGRLTTLGSSPRSLDPHFDTFPACTAVTRNVYNNLLRFSPDLTEIVTESAASMPEQPDDMTYSFNIRTGIKWQNLPPLDGRDFTSEDVKYSLERQMTDEPGIFQHAYFFLNRIESIETPDAETVVIKTNAPYAPLLSYIASPWTAMVPREVVEQEGDLTKVAIGTGPFILDEWQEDVRFEMSRNPDYWEENLPYVDNHTILITDPTAPDTAATLFIEGDADAGAFSLAQLQRVQEGRPEANYQPVPSQFWRQFRMQPTTPDQPYAAPLDDIRVRQAIVQAIDKQAVLDFVYEGQGLLTHGPILPIYPLWALTEELAPHDLAAARALLEEANFSEYSAPFIWATSIESDLIGEVLAQQLGEINVNLELTPMETAAYYNQTYAYDYTFSSHVPLNNPDPDENLAAYFGRSSTFFKHHNEAIWDLIDQQATELDYDARKAIVDEAQRAIVLDYPMNFMFTINLHLFTGAQVKGWFYPVDLYEGRKATAWIDPNVTT